MDLHVSSIYLLIYGNCIDVYYQKFNMFSSFIISYMYYNFVDSIENSAQIVLVVSLLL